MDRAGVDYFERARAWRNRPCVRPTPSRMVADRAALYLELHRRRRRAVLMARRALAIATPVAAASQRSQRSRQDCSNGSFHCAVNSSRAAEAAIGSTDMSAA